jgi:mannose-6-phosphate isomerase-like protein (cupin superfamily)
MKAFVSRMTFSTTLVAAGFASACLLLPSGAGLAQPKTERPLASALVRAEDAVPTRGDWGELRRYFRGDNSGTRDMVVLVVTLKPGQAPRPPHQHAEEEFMILAEGAGTWTVDGNETPARKGDVVYAAPWTMHGLKNTGKAPLTYYMVKWSNLGVKARERPEAEFEQNALAPGHDSEQQERIIAEIKKLGRGVLVDQQRPGTPIVKVNFNGLPVPHTKWAYLLKSLPALEEFSFC